MHFRRILAYLESFLGRVPEKDKKAKMNIDIYRYKFPLKFDRHSPKFLICCRVSQTVKYV